MTARQAVNKFCKENGIDISTGGQLYTPKEWRERGELYGLKSKLVIVHDGGDFAPYLNLDYGCYKLFDKMVEFFSKHGYYIEACTCWYSAVYPID
jgi:hypothetical protein